MSASDHLTRNQVTAYSAGSLAASETRSVGGHLIRCVECRGLLQLPDAEKFWTAVMGDVRSQELQGNDRSVDSVPPYFPAIGRFFAKPSSLAWGGAALIMILGLSLALLFSASSEPGAEREVAKAFETEGPISIPRREQTEEPPVMRPDHAYSTIPKDQPPSRASTEPRSPGPRQGQAPKSLNDQRGATASSKSRDVSLTRGAVSKCGTERTFEMELGYDESQLVLKWRPVPNAAKYHLFVSDDDEILIDEFETESATSYLLKRQLDPKKSYKWKVMITLESGQVIAADSQKFTSEDIRSVQRKRSSRRQRSVTRCSGSR